MIISLIAAMDRNRLIGCDNGLPWHLPDDFKHFKAITMGKPVIMGRKTFESIGKPLPGRKNIVLSRTGFKASGIKVVPDIDQALTEANDAEEVMIIGGANLYRQMIDRADRMYLTQVDGQFTGDAWFPEFGLDEWEIISTNHYQSNAKNNYDFNITVYSRR
jgi:dihydrofolate reductase